MDEEERIERFQLLIRDFMQLLNSDYCPEDIFSANHLKLWAEENGYIHRSEVEKIMDKISNDHTKP